MIALLLAHVAYAQDPAPTEPPPVEPIPEPAPPETLPPPVEEPVPETPATEPAWEAVTVEPGDSEPVPTETTPDGQLNLTPWVSVPDELRSKLLRFGIAGELGSLGNDDPAYDLFSEGDSMGSAGVALGFTLVNHLSLVGSWHHFRHGATVVVGGTDSSTDADFESNSQEFRSAWIANEGTLGLRVDASVRDVLFPYVTARGTLLGARMRLDDDPTVNDNPGQVQAGGLTQGVMGTAGFELRIPPNSDIQVAWTLEFGHSWLARADFGAFGSMQPGGFVARSGLGLRF